MTILKPASDFSPKFKQHYRFTSLYKNHKAYLTWARIAAFKSRRQNWQFIGN